MMKKKQPNYESYKFADLSAIMDTLQRKINALLPALPPEISDDIQDQANKLEDTVVIAFVEQYFEDEEIPELSTSQYQQLLPRLSFAQNHFVEQYILLQNVNFHENFAIVLCASCLTDIWGKITTGKNNKSWVEKFCDKNYPVYYELYEKHKVTNKNIFCDPDP